jgi:hypothetical protein
VIELHPVHVEHNQTAQATDPIETAICVVTTSQALALNHQRYGRIEIRPSGRGNGFPLPAGRREDERNDLSSALGHPDYPERLRLIHGRFLFFTTWSEEDFASALTNHEATLLDVWVLDGGGQILRDLRKKHIAPEQGVADCNGGEGAIPRSSQLTTK